MSCRNNNLKLHQIAMVTDIFGIMAYPIVTPFHWSVGRYVSYTLYPDGNLAGTIHPPGFAFDVNETQCLSAMDNLLFLSSRNQSCTGSWFVWASFPCPYKCIKSNHNFICELILLMGAKSTPFSLHDPQIHLYFYSVQRDLSLTAITEAFQECSGSSDFICRIFDHTLQCSKYKSMHIQYSIRSMEEHSLHGR
jgi:hypothetical protein